VSAAPAHKALGRRREVSAQTADHDAQRDRHGRDCTLDSPGQSIEPRGTTHSVCTLMTVAMSSKSAS
jgi:hypothetical protein